MTKLTPSGQARAAHELEGSRANFPIAIQVTRSAGRYLIKSQRKQ